MLERSRGGRKALEKKKGIYKSQVAKKSWQRPNLDKKQKEVICEQNDPKRAMIRLRRVGAKKVSGEGFAHKETQAQGHTTNPTNGNKKTPKGNPHTHYRCFQDFSAYA